MLRCCLFFYSYKAIYGYLFLLKKRKNTTVKNITAENYTEFSPVKAKTFQKPKRGKSNSIYTNHNVLTSINNDNNLINLNVCPQKKSQNVLPKIREKIILNAEKKRTEVSKERKLYERDVSKERTRVDASRERSRFEGSKEKNCNGNSSANSNGKGNGYPENSFTTKSDSKYGSARKPSKEKSIFFRKSSVSKQDDNTNTVANNNIRIIEDFNYINNNNLLNDRKTPTITRKILRTKSNNKLYLIYLT